MVATVCRYKDSSKNMCPGNGFSEYHKGFDNLVQLESVSVLVCFIL